MAISDAALKAAALSIAAVPDLSMDPDHLVEDVFLLSSAFGEQDEFEAAVAATIRAIGLFAGCRVTSSSLKYSFEGWRSFHYQHRVSQGGRADCRIVFKETKAGIEVKGFGHRSVPKDLYARMAETR